MVGRIVTCSARDASRAWELTGTGRHSVGLSGRISAAPFSDLGQVMVAGWLRRVLLPSRRTSSGPTAEAERRRPLAGLSTAQLCALWRKSRAGLRAAPTAAEQARVANARALLLEELERREPEAMADWLQSGAREPEGPSAYLVR